MVVPGRPDSFVVHTMGCKVNTYDTSLLEKRLENLGLKSQASGQKMHVINTCAVTEKSVNDAQKLVRRIKEKDPTAKVVVTGCAAQVDSARFAHTQGVDLVIANSHKPELEKIITDFLIGDQNQDGREKTAPAVFHSNIFKQMALEEGGGLENARTRVFLKIQDGCNSFCSFCIIPFARGRSRSLSAQNIIDRINEFTRDGFKEVILTGVHCGDYEDKSQGARFSDLVEQVLNETSILRVRLSSLEPIEVDEKLWRLFAESAGRLCPHLHVSLQTVNSDVLKGMRRHYGKEAVADFFERKRTILPNGFLGMDVITGFPGESQDDFDETFQFLANESGWTRIHVFPYSRRPGTTADRRTDQVPTHQIHQRAKRLRALSLQRFYEKAQAQVGRVKSVLILEGQAHGGHGLSRDYWPVFIAEFAERPDLWQASTQAEWPLQITDVRLSANAEPLLVGTLV